MIPLMTTVLNSQANAIKKASFGGKVADPVIDILSGFDCIVIFLVDLLVAVFGIDYRYWRTVSGIT